MKKKLRPEDIAYEPIEQEKQPLWMTQMEGPKGASENMRPGVWAAVVVVIICLLLIYVILDFKDGYSTDSERTEQGPSDTERATGNGPETGL